LHHRQIITLEQAIYQTDGQIMVSYLAPNRTDSRFGGLVHCLTGSCNYNIDGYPFDDPMQQLRVAVSSVTPGALQYSMITSAEQGTQAIVSTYQCGDFDCHRSNLVLCDQTNGFNPLLLTGSLGSFSLFMLAENTNHVVVRVTLCISSCELV
jgi:hypothetical protein